MSIHILGYGPITEHLYRFMSTKFEVFIYSDLRLENELPILGYDQLNPTTFGHQDTFVIGWRGMPDNDSRKMQILSLLSKNLTRNQRLINLSSVAVYGNTPTPALEDQEPSPINPYGQGKRALEQYCELNLDANVCHLRISNVFGDYRFDDVVNRILRCQKMNMEMPIVDPMQIERDFVSINTLVSVICQIVCDTRENQSIEILNVSSNQSITLQRLIELVQAVDSTPINFLENPIPPSMIRRSSISNKKITNLYPTIQTNEVNNLKDYIRNFSSI